ncbi:MAG: hypothetical protein II109_01585, partial [Paludibacteraceae bacterium]|nr:hypothetical protein [Paludibacteraceae bacterium]
MLTAGLTAYAQEANPAAAARQDSASHYRPAPVYPQNPGDLNAKSSTDLGQPENISTDVSYDPATGNYYYNTRVGDENLDVPFYLQSNEYADYMAQQSMREYYKNRTAEEKSKKNKFSITDMKFNIGKADRVFGPGGIQIKLQGSAELDFGLNFKRLKDPSLSERSQKP